MKDFFSGKTIAVTGGTGSFGKTILKRLLSFDVKQVRVVSRDEQKHVALLRKYKDTRIRSIIGDVRDYDTLAQAFSGVDYVFHAAAIKHVPIAENHTWQAVQTNVIGAQNALRAADVAGVKRFIAVSTDKAVEPVNAMGMTKAIQEKLISAYKPSSDMITGCIRYGNVLASNGSVVPFFMDLLKNGERVLPITHQEMTRFILTLDEAIDLVMYAITEMRTGDLFVSDIPALLLTDLAEVMLEHFGGGSWKVVGIRPGEKLHEILLSSDELRRATKEYSAELDKYFYRVAHDHVQDGNFTLVSSSCKRMTKQEIKSMLINEGVIR